MIDSIAEGYRKVPEWGIDFRNVLLQIVKEGDIWTTM